MTGAEESVKQVHPRAWASRQSDYRRKTYWLIYPSRTSGMYIASGNTKAQAWKAAAQKIQAAATASAQ